MKKTIKLILFIIFGVILIGIIFANIDYSRIKKDEKPILSIYMGKNKDTKADQYYGLGYTITKCPEVDGEKTSYQLVLLTSSHVCYAGTIIEPAN